MVTDPPPEPPQAQQPAQTAQPAQPPQPAQDVKLPFPLQPGEHILGMYRRHWMYLWPRTALWIGFAIVPVVVLYWLLFSVFDADSIQSWFWIIAGVWLLFWTVRIFLNWYQYDNDIWVVTNQRIVDALKPTPIGLKVSTADLVNIQDMTVERRGIFQTALNYGSIHCETAADNKDFVITGVSQPQEVQSLIDRERDRERIRTRGG